MSTLQTVAKKKTSETKLLQEWFVVLKALCVQPTNKVHKLEHTLAFEEAELLAKATDIDVLRREVSDFSSTN